MAETKAVLEPNTVKACHMRYKDGIPYVSEVEYVWHIPKALRQENIKRGDVIQVASKGRTAKVVVTDVFREEFEETGKQYKSIRGTCGLSIDLENVNRFH